MLEITGRVHPSVRLNTLGSVVEGANRHETGAERHLRHDHIHRRYRDSGGDPTSIHRIGSALIWLVANCGGHTTARVYSFTHSQITLAARTLSPALMLP